MKRVSQHETIMNGWECVTNDPLICKAVSLAHIEMMWIAYYYYSPSKKASQLFQTPKISFWL